MNHNHYLIMTIIMILTGLLSNMNVYADKLSDIHLSINDLYMISLMTGYMLFFMALYYYDIKPLIISLCIIIFSFIAIRKQFFVNENQFLLGMIPHHSMAVLMSKRMSEKENTIQKLLNNIIQSQEDEINYMKKKLVLNR